MLRRWLGLALGAAVTVGLSVAAAPMARSEEKVLNVYNWSDYIGADVVAQFEKETGIKVNNDTFDANETLEAKLSTGNSGYDIGVPTLTPFLQRGITAGLYQKIDKSKLKNYGNLDPDLLKTMAKYDPGNTFAIPWISASDIIAINVEAVKKAWPDAPLDSWDLMLKPENLQKFASCGVEFLDSPTDVIPVVLHYLHLDPNTHNTDDIKAAADLMFKLRPYIRKFDSSGYINDLAGGDACIAFGWSTDVSVAAKRAREANKPYTIKIIMPKEGTLTYIDTMAIPNGAPHYDLALQWLDFVMRTEVALQTAKEYSARVGEITTKAQMPPEIANDPGVYPPPAVAATLFTIEDIPREVDKFRNRIWTRIKTGR